MKRKLRNTLLWSQKYTKTDMLYVSKGGFWLLVNQGIQVLSGLVLAIAFANLLPKEAFGTYQFIMSAAAILGGLLLSMAVPVKRAAAKGIDGALRFGFKTQLRWSIGMVFLSGIVSVYYFLNGNEILGKSFLVIGALVPFAQGFSLYKSFLIGKQLFKESAMLGFFLRPVLIITVLTTLYFTENPFLLVLVYFTTYTTTTCFLYFLTISRYKLANKYEQISINYGKHLSVMGVVSTIGNHLEKILIFHFLGAAQLAIYAIAVLPTNHILKLIKLMGELVLPKFVQREYREIKNGMFSKITIVFSASALGVLIFIIFAPYIYTLIFPAYPEAVVLAQISMLAVLTKFGNLYTQAFNAHEMKRQQYIIRISAITIKILLLIFLIPLYGILGAIYAVLFTHLYWIILATMLFYTHNPDKKNQG